MRVAVAVVSALLWLGATAAAATDSLVPDVTFGSTVLGLPGRTVVPLQGSTPLWSYSALASGGRIVLAGTVCAPPGCQYGRKLALARLNADGSLDATFNPAGAQRGKLVFDFGSAVDVAGMALDGAGRIVVAGRLDSDETVVARFLADGTLDTSFAPAAVQPGVYRRSFGTNEAVQAVVADASSRIVIGGHVGADPFVARITAGGGTDFGFNAGGPVPGVKLLTSALGAGFTAGSVTHLLLDTGGRLLATILQDNVYQFVPHVLSARAGDRGVPGVIRVLDGGTLDATFGGPATPGVARLANFPAPGSISAWFIGRVYAALDAQQRVVIGGLASDCPSGGACSIGPVAYRFTAAGLEDATAYSYSPNWPVAGIPYTPISNAIPIGQLMDVAGVAIDASGRALIAGTLEANLGYVQGVEQRDSRLFLFRTTPSLAPDPAFAPDVPSYPCNPECAPARGIRSYDLTDTNYAVPLSPYIPPRPPAFALDAANSRALLAGPSAKLPTDGAVLRVGTNSGAPDTTFGSAGLAFTGQVGVGFTALDYGALTVLPDGRLTLFARRSLAVPEVYLNVFAMLRLQPSGQPDVSFEPLGEPPGVKAWTLSPDATQFTTGNPGRGRTLVDADGRLLAVVDGTFPLATPSFRGFVARFNADGSLDPTFAAGGATPGLLFPTIDPGQSTTITGIVQDAAKRYYLWGVSGTIGHFVARYLSDGSPDPTFNDTVNPFVIVRYSAATEFAHSADVVRIDANGRVLVGGIYVAKSDTLGADARAAIARFNADGTRDTSFNAGGSFPGALLMPAPGVCCGGGLSSVRSVDQIVELDDGRLLVGHEDFYPDPNGPPPVPLIRRILANGTLDAGYGGGAGYVRLQASCYIRWAGAVKIANGGSYWLCEGSPNATPPVVMRLTAAGEKDATFATDGEFTVPSGPASGHVNATDLAIDTGGRLLLAGHLTTAVRQYEREVQAWVARFVVQQSGPAPTTTTLSPSSASVQAGVPVTLTATVNGSNPTGTVAFRDGGVSIAACAARPLSGSGDSRTAQCTTTLSPGTHSLTAAYAGDGANLASSSAAVAVTVGLRGTTTTLSTNVPSYAAGSSAVLTALVTGFEPTGTVLFRDGGVIPGCQAVPVTGTGNSRSAQCLTPSLSAGTHTFSASYGGDANNMPSSSADVQRLVARYATVVAVSSSNGSVGPGVPFTLTATVTGYGPTGTVAFANPPAGLPGCAAVPLVGTGNARTAQCAVSSLPPGSYTLIATYSGDGNNDVATGSVQQLVSGACAGFTDVPSTSPFCPSVEWMKNRSVTQGCTSATLFCPASPVSRLAMAAFMQRLGDALSSEVLWRQAEPGAIDLEQGGAVVCQTDDLVVSGYPRRVFVDAVLAGSAASDTVFSARVVASFDGGANWVSVFSPSAVQAVVRAGHWGQARDFGTGDLGAGTTVRIGVRANRDGVVGLGNLLDSRCALRVVVGNRDGSSSPYDWR